jgi:hypothetical protein
MPHDVRFFLGEGRVADKGQPAPGAIAVYPALFSELFDLGDVDTEEDRYLLLGCVVPPEESVDLDS